MLALGSALGCVSLTGFMVWCRAAADVTAIVAGHEEHALNRHKTNMGSPTGTYTFHST